MPHFWDCYYWNSVGILCVVCDLLIWDEFSVAVMYFNRFLEKRVTSFVRKCCCCLNGKKEEIHQVTIINHRNIEDIHNPSVASDISQSKLDFCFFWFIFRRFMRLIINCGFDLQALYFQKLARRQSMIKPCHFNLSKLQRFLRKWITNRKTVMKDVSYFL